MIYIRIVMICFILALMLTAWYLWHRRNGAFLVFDVSGNPELHQILTVTAVALVAISVLGIFLLFSGNKYLNLITLFLGSGAILIFALIISKNKH